jgi:hypothetical protein
MKKLCFQKINEIEPQHIWAIFAYPALRIFATHTPVQWLCGTANAKSGDYSADT